MAKSKKKTVTDKKPTVKKSKTVFVKGAYSHREKKLIHEPLQGSINVKEEEK